MKLHWRRLTVLAVVVMIAAACDPSKTPSPMPTSTASASSAVLAPQATSSPVPSTPDATPRPAPPRTPAPAGWSKRSLVRGGNCGAATAVIDAAGRYHVASVCGEKVRYTMSSDGRDWHETSFVPPAHRLEIDPQLTFDGDTVYMAYSLVAPTDGGCGDDGLEDIGVYTRSRKASGGPWSDPVRVGVKGDEVQSFRVVGGAMHLTVATEEGQGPRFYESIAGSTVSRIRIPGAYATSLRVGDDGRARIAYATGDAIRYARVDAGVLTSTTVASSDATLLQWPQLVLGPGDRAYMVWIQNRDGGGGCTGLEPGPLDGVYFGTDASGTWKVKRLTRTPSEAALTYDPATRRLQVIVGEGNRLTRYVSTDGAAWKSMKIPSSKGLGGVVVRVNPVTGRTAIIAADYDKGIFLVTGP